MNERTDAVDDDSTSSDDLDEHGLEGAANFPSGSQLPTATRRALTTLLTNRFITRSRNRSAWDALLAYENEIRERLADMYLLLVVDKDYEVAFKRQDPAEDSPRLLRRDKPLHRDASLLLIHLRKEHTYTDAADEPVVITRAQVGEFLRPFREDGDGDEARFESRVDKAIRAVVELKLLTPDPDADYLFTVSPAVVPLIGADEMMRMERHFVQAAKAEGATDGSDEVKTDEDLT
ncbi:DUF4194 domain-containing protein [Saccharopolyspora phatthalungensis]|uniref:DUF4194 domain-containing protein n=1 Tax=Saccharopolyspora phatthalungensis TaxID=664693 RepID=A0A840Q007_9PSEU|nr:DUF4194 domain-containing protein [Saccharopolyspora phatthalungensis]MBB5153327.1 hypothetical protein [Saccharopolyspora phatthalungensis]